jgi:hypothetical protein
MSDAGGAAFNPMVRTEDHAPEPPAEDSCADVRDDQADDGHSTEEE